MLITMTVLAALAALALAVSVGYHLGRCAGSAPSTWRRRTSRVALGRQTVNLVALIAVRRLQRRLRTDPMVQLLGLRVAARRGVLRVR